MIERTRNERGWVLVVAMIVMALMLSIGLGAYAYVDQQSAESGKERTREAAFNLAEGALTAELYTLSRNWPGTTAFPVCDQASTDPVCPSNAKIASRYNQVDFTGTGANARVWQTRVIDDDVVTVNGAPVDLHKFYDDKVVKPQTSPAGVFPTLNAYDANNNGQAWVRATASTRGKTRTIVALVKIEQIPISFPHAVMTAGRIRVITNGNANGGTNTCPGMSSSSPPPIVCTAKDDGTPTPINVRCTSPTFSSVTKDAHDFSNGGTNCLEWATGQVAPIGGVFCGASHFPPTDPAPDNTGCGPYSDDGVVPSEALDGLRDQAQTSNTYCGVGGTNNPGFCVDTGSSAGCPRQSALETLPTTQPTTVFVEQTPAAGCQYSGNAGTQLFPGSQPGTWVVAGGAAPCTTSSPALDFSGSVVVNALLYSANLQGWSNAPSGCSGTPSPPNINIRGNARIVGAIALDADGLLQINANSNNVRYNDVVIKDAKVFGTAGIIQNTWRELTAGQ